MSTITALTRKFNSVKQQRQRYDRDWKMNLAFYSGKQWVVWDNAFNRVIEWIPPNTKKPRFITNIIMPIVRLYLALLTKNKPDFRVDATTADQDDVSKAKICKQFLQYEWEANDFDDVFRQALLWALVCGNGFIKTYYDVGTERYEVNGEVHYLGDVAIDFCSPFELFFDPFARTIDEVSWVIHARIRPLEYIEMKYGVKVPGEYESSLFEWGLGQRKGQDGSLPSAVVKEYWERPNERNPQGRYIVFVGNKILVDDANPYADVCPIPFTHVKCIPNPGSFYADSVVTSLRSVQVVYNKLKSDIVENTVKLTNPPLLAPVNALLQAPDFDPGEIIYYNPLIGGDIKQLQVVPYAAPVMNLLMRTMQERDDISGLSQMALGGSARGLRSAQAIQQMFEQDRIVMSIVTDSYEDMIETTLTYVLRLARKFMDTPRMLRIMGENETREIMQFKNEDIPPNADVHVVARSTLPLSENQEQQYLFGLWDRGIIQDPRLLLRISAYGNNAELYNDVELDSQQALRENDRMKDGKPVQVEDFHNHFVHVVEHNRFRKTVEYENLSDERKGLFAKHVMQHQQFMQQQAQGGEQGADQGQSAEQATTRRRQKSPGANQNGGSGKSRNAAF